MKKILTLFAFFCVWFLSAQDTFVKDNFIKKVQQIEHISNNDKFFIKLQIIKKMKIGLEIWEKLKKISPSTPKYFQKFDD